MAKENVVYYAMERHSVIERNEITCGNVDENGGHYEINLKICVFSLIFGSLNS